MLDDAGASVANGSVRAAAIDIGTNSVLLLVGETSSAGRMVAIHQEALITRLGQGVDERHALDPEAIARTLEALRHYAARMDALGVGSRCAVGTSALRDACNASTFTAPAGRLLGCPVEVISGKREATLIMRGVSSSFESIDERTIIFDVGGGSTEFVRCGSAPRLQSLDVGTVRLTERHLTTDPPDAGQLRAIRDEVNRQLARLGDAFERPQRLIGVAGTVTTLLAVELELTQYDSSRIDGGRLSRNQIDGLRRRLSDITLKERKELAGLDPGRADVIVAGAELVGTVMTHFALDELFVSDRGVRWGLLLQQAHRTCTGGTMA